MRMIKRRIGWKAGALTMLTRASDREPAGSTCQQTRIHRLIFQSASLIPIHYLNVKFTTPNSQSAPSSRSHPHFKSTKTFLASIVLYDISQRPPRYKNRKPPLLPVHQRGQDLIDAGQRNHQRDCHKIPRKNRIQLFHLYIVSSIIAAKTKPTSAQEKLFKKFVTAANVSQSWNPTNRSDFRVINSEPYSPAKRLDNRLMKKSRSLAQNFADSDENLRHVGIHEQKRSHKCEKKQRKKCWPQL